MLANALAAFARFDAEAAMIAIDEDKPIDQDYKTALRELANYMMEDPRSISRVINILGVKLSLKHIGDHIKKISPSKLSLSSKVRIFVTKSNIVGHVMEKAYRPFCSAA